MNRHSPFTPRAARWIGAVLTAGLVAASWSAVAAPPAAAPITVVHPYASPTPPGATTGAVYLQEVTNGGPVADQLIGARSSVADHVEVHRMQMDGDVMRMRAVPEVDVPAGGHVALTAAAGYHLMLIGLKKPWALGDRLPVTLQFRRAGDVDVELLVEPRVREGGSPAAGAHRVDDDAHRR